MATRTRTRLADRPGPVVRKFGGTSVGSAEAIRRVGRILGDEPGLVTVSAMAGVTETLLRSVDAASRGARTEVDALCADMAARHHDTASALLGRPSRDLEVGHRIDALLSEARLFLEGILLLREASPRSRDAVASIGERLSSMILCAYQATQGVDAVSVDAREWMRTDDRFGGARPIGPEVARGAARLRELAARGHQVITEGFIGATADGITTTLGRGGSDYTAALLGAAIRSPLIEIWTDVTGVLTADPRVVPAARPVPRLTYSEAAELSYFGAKVLHPETVRPAVEAGVPLMVRNSVAPTDGGTRIDATGDPSHPVKAITSKRRVVAVTIESTRMLGAHGFLRGVFEIFDRFGISVDVIATAEVSVTITLDPHPALDACIQDLSRIGSVWVADDRATISIIGEGIKSTPGIGARAFSALGGINVELISMGASRLNLTLLVVEPDLAQALGRIHHEMFEEGAARAPRPRAAR